MESFLKFLVENILPENSQFNIEKQPTENGYRFFITAPKELLGTIIGQKGKTIKVKPKIIVEVGYEEIQKSTNYNSGFALRFPRFQRIRPEKGVEEADTIERVKELYKSQGKAG